MSMSELKLRVQELNEVQGRHALTNGSTARAHEAFCTNPAPGGGDGAAGDAWKWKRTCGGDGTGKQKCCSFYVRARAVFGGRRTLRRLQQESDEATHSTQSASDYPGSEAASERSGKSGGTSSDNTLRPPGILGSEVNVDDESGKNDPIVRVEVADVLHVCLHHRGSVRSGRVRLYAYSKDVMVSLARSFPLVTKKGGPNVTAGLLAPYLFTYTQEGGTERVNSIASKLNYTSRDETQVEWEMSAAFAQVRPAPALRFEHCSMH